MNAHTRVTLQPGYVLHHWPYRDTSLLVEILTRDYGRVGLVARGAKRSKSRLYGLLQPFIPLILSWTGRGDLGTLNSAESQGPVNWLSGRSLMSGFYVNELLLRLLHRHDPHARLFGEYVDVLWRLSEMTVKNGTGFTMQSQNGMNHCEQRALRIFEKNLLRELGYGLVLDHDVVTGQPIMADRHYDYFPDRGPVLSSGKSGYLEKQMGRESSSGDDCITLCGHSLVSLAQDDLTDDVSLLEAKKLMRIALKRHLGDKPLGSRQLFRDFSSSILPRGRDAIET